MKDAFCVQFKRIINSSKFIISFWVVLGFVLVHFVLSLLTYQNMDVSSITNPFMMILISGMNQGSEGRYFLQFLPFILVVPAAFSLADDITSGEIVYLRYRMSSVKYVASKAFAVFFATFLVFEIPFLIELFLYFISFPARSGALYYSFNYFEEGATEFVKGQPLYGLLLFSPFLYSLVMGLKFSFVCAVFAVFTLSCSTFGTKMKVLLFLPAYLILYFLIFAEKAFGFSFSTNYNYYLTSVNNSPALRWTAMWLLVLALLVISAALLVRYERKDCI